MLIKLKDKPCKGTGQAKGYGCGKLTKYRKYGLCMDCYKKWLFGSDKGKELLNRSMVRAKKIVTQEEKRVLREKKKELMTRSDYEKILQSIINSIVRIVDIDRGCISCDHGWNEPFKRQRHAGHRYSIGAYPAIRFNLFNIFGQCSVCNNYLSGNETNFDKGILKHWGREYLDKLEEIKLKYQELKLTIPELKEAIQKASEVKRQLIKGKYFSREEVNKMIGIY